MLSAYSRKESIFMEKREITLSDLISILLKRFWIILAVMIVGGLLAYYYATNMVTPLYTAQTKYLVDTAILSDNTESSANIEEQRNNVLSKLMASNYIEILNTRMFADYLADILQDMPLSNEYSDDNLFNMIKYTYEENTETYTVTVTAFSPEDARIISECIQNESEKYLVRKKPSAAETLQVIDRAWDKKNPSNVNVLMTVILGLMVGAIIPFIILLIVDMNDSRIKDEKSISNMFNLPVLGSIPEYTVPVKNSKVIDE